VSTSKESTPLGALPTETYANFVPVAEGALVAGEPDPDNPPWNTPVALLVWVTSIVLITLVPAITILPYIFYLYSRGGRQAVDGLSFANPTVTFLSIIGIIPAHLLTVALVWCVVTRFGKRPFWKTIGWSWSNRVGLWTSAGLAVALLILGGLLTKLIGGEPTQIDQIIENSPASRFAVAFLATMTAPFVEELVYRGVVYPALLRGWTRLASLLFHSFQDEGKARRFGMVLAVTCVSLLFMAVHVPQYQTNLGVIAAIALLSISLTLMRAITGRLLPCFIMHLVFNGLQSLVIIFEPYINRAGSSEQKAAGLILTHVVHIFF
jgi:membrane protease YdiL (CAAX protease family)